MTLKTDEIVADEWIIRQVKGNVLNVYLRIGEQPFKEVHAAAHPSTSGTARIVEITSDGDLVDKYFGERNLFKLREKICDGPKFIGYAIFVTSSLTAIPS